MARFAREDTDPLTYLRSTYYEQWLRGLERLLIEKGLVSANEIAGGKAADSGVLPAVPAARVPAMLMKGSTARRADAGPPRFGIGETVRVRNLNPRGHTRAPRYCRGKQGVVERDHGTFVLPDSHAVNGDERPQRCYAVRFSARALWGEGAWASDSVFIDLWDDYLEAA
jgi:nitrile hydratase